jgi:hypothetical protein
MPVTSPYIPVSPTNNFQVNNSMQLPPTHYQNLNSSGYQYSNPNNSMTVGKMVTPVVQNQPIVTGNFSKPITGTYFVDHRNPSNQFIGSSHPQQFSMQNIKKY